LKIKAGSRV